MFKIGKLFSRAGELKWQSKSNNMKVQSKDDMSQMSRFSEFSNATVNSCTRKDFSVFTPSIVRTRASTYKSMATSTGFHMSNPNP